MRLDKLLANSGLGSRKEVKAIIKDSRVSVDGNIVRNPGHIIDAHNSQIVADGQTIDYREFYYIMLHKPAGVVSATRDNLHETVVDLLPHQYHHLNLFPVGRLDKDTEGLLLLTNDGRLAHSLLSPRRRVPKTYYALVQGRIDSRDVELFHEGIVLDDDFITLPAELSILESSHRSKVQVTIFEGKYHQVKRMFRAIGKDVEYLKRIAMGTLKLDGDLAPGEIRELTEDELKELKRGG